MKKTLIGLFTLSVILVYSLGVLADPSPDPGPFIKVPNPVTTTAVIPQ